MGIFKSLFGVGDRKDTPPADPSEDYMQADVYRDLRGQLLGLSPEEIGRPAEADEPIAILMETGYPEAVASLVCVADGTTSLYFSNGGGYVGCGEHEAVRAAALSFLAHAANFTGEMKRATAFPLPAEGYVTFYVVTTSGVLAAQAGEDDLGNMREKLSLLFHKGHEVIRAIREHSPE